MMAVGASYDHASALGFSGLCKPVPSGKISSLHVPLLQRVLSHAPRSRSMYTLRVAMAVEIMQRTGLCRALL